MTILEELLEPLRLRAGEGRISMGVRQNNNRNIDSTVSREIIS